MKATTIVTVLLASLTWAAPAPAMPSPPARPAHLQYAPGRDTRLAKFKKEEKRVVPDTMKRSTLHKINELREEKKKRKHYKKDEERSLDKRNPASDRKIHPRFSNKGLSEEQIKYYMDRYEERLRLREKYDKMSGEK